MDTANQIQAVKMDASSLSQNSYFPRTSTLQLGGEMLLQVDPVTSLLKAIELPHAGDLQKPIIRNPA